MTIDFEVEYENYLTEITVYSKVYAIDRDRFLIVDENDKFIWVPISDCRLPVTYATCTSREIHVV